LLGIQHFQKRAACQFVSLLEALPRPLTIRQASLRLTPQRANLTRFSGTVGSSDLEATGSIDNIISWAFRDDTLKGSSTIRSNRFDLDEWRTGGEEGDLQVIQVPPKIDFALNATVKQLTYDKLTMTGAQGRLRLRDRRVTLEDFRMSTLGGQIAGPSPRRSRRSPLFRCWRRWPGMPGAP
jgi:hypothetical protein